MYAISELSEECVATVSDTTAGQSAADIAFVLCKCRSCLPNVFTSMRLRRGCDCFAYYASQHICRGLPYTLDPRVLYRGYVANTLNMGLGTGFQFLVNGSVKRMMTGNEHRQLAPSEQLGAGFVAGSASALLISPTVSEPSSSGATDDPPLS